MSFRSRVAFAGVLALVAAGAATAQVPSTDIFVLQVDGDTVGEPRRITDREGYDNQPQFLPDGKALVYASIRESGGDIYRFDLKTGEATVVRETPESEYSPTPIPGRKAVSVVGTTATSNSSCGRTRWTAASPSCCCPTSPPWATTRGRTSRA